MSLPSEIQLNLEDDFEELKELIEVLVEKWGTEIVMQFLGHFIKK